MCGMSQSYAVITLGTMMLKHRCKSKFYAALLSMQEKEEKINLYSKQARKAGIKVLNPDVSKSGIDFKEIDGNILYGLKSIKGVGASSLPAIIENQPYDSLENIFEKHTSKTFNKKVGQALIKAGALDCFNDNRYITLNKFMDIRKDKEERYAENLFNRDVCMEMEREVLGTSLKHISWIGQIDEDVPFEKEMELIMCSEKISKKQTKYGSLELSVDGEIVKGLLFGKAYMAKAKDLTKPSTERRMLTVRGKKGDDDVILISSVDIRFVKEEVNFDYV